MASDEQSTEPDDPWTAYDRLRMASRVHRAATRALHRTEVRLAFMAGFATAAVMMMVGRWWHG